MVNGTQILRDCSGLAVLHVLRSGLHSPSASGSGVIVSQSDAGKWSGASAILVDFDLPQGVGVADVVIVLNHKDHLGLKERPNVILGNTLTIDSGPMPQSDTLSGQLHNMPHATDRAFFYAKSQGRLVELDLGTMIFRTADEENERFDGVHGVSQTQILSGQVGTPFDASDHLYRTLDALTQQSMHISGLPGSGKCPGDCRVKAPVTTEAYSKAKHHGAADSWRSPSNLMSSKFRSFSIHVASMCFCLQRGWSYCCDRRRSSRI